MSHRSINELRMRRSALQEEIVNTLGQINIAEVRLGEDATGLRYHSRILLAELTDLDMKIAAAGQGDNAING